MGILWLMGAQQSAVLLLLLVAALGLTWWEARQQDFDCEADGTEVPAAPVLVRAASQVIRG